MPIELLWVASLVLATVAAMPAAAHLLELPNKIKLSGEDYLITQRLYRGWAFAGVVVGAALLSTLALLFMLREWPRAAALAGIAFLCMAGTQIVDWTHTYPVNRITQDWTHLPGDWQTLRRRWEYAHAANAVLNLIALLALISCLLWMDDARQVGIDTASANYARPGDWQTQYEIARGPARDADAALPRQPYM